MLILAGGFGTRLINILGSTPKVLAPINGEPFLKLQIENWKKQGINSFTFLLHYEAQQIIKFLQNQSKLSLADCNLNWIVESEPLDTGGAISNAVLKLDLNEDLIIINADTWLSSGIKMIKNSAYNSIGIVEVSDTSRYGEIIFDQNLNILDIKEKICLKKPGWINAGISKIHSDLFRNWDTCPFSLERNLFPRLINMSSLKAIKLQSDFIDIGVPIDYHKFCKWKYQ